MPRKPDHSPVATRMEAARSQIEFGRPRSSARPQIGGSALFRAGGEFSSRDLHCETVLACNLSEARFHFLLALKCLQPVPRGIAEEPGLLIEILSVNVVLSRSDPSSRVLLRA